MKIFNREIISKWHGVLNGYNTAKNHHGFMYEAKNIAEQMPLMIKLFNLEDANELPEIHQQCSQSKPEKIDNYLICCKGVKCKECPHLKAIDNIKGTGDKIDIGTEVVNELKALTCISHILSEGGDINNEGYILTKSDVMFWNNVHESLAMGSEYE